MAGLISLAKARMVRSACVMVEPAAWMFSIMWLAPEARMSAVSRAATVAASPTGRLAAISSSGGSPENGR